MDNLYYVVNNGCDDETCGLVRMPDSLFPWFKEFIENLNKNSTYGCQPKITVYRITMNDLREAEELDAMFSRLYLDGKQYVLVDAIKHKMVVI